MLSLMHIYSREQCRVVDLMKELNLILKYIYIAITAGKHRLVSRPDALFPLVSRQ